MPLLCSPGMSFLPLPLSAATAFVFFVPPRAEAGLRVNVEAAHRWRGGRRIDTGYSLSSIAAVNDEIASSRAVNNKKSL